MFQKSLISFSLILLLALPLFGGIKGSDYGIYEEKIRIVFKLTHDRDFKVFTLENPRRIVIDVYDEGSVSELKLPAGMEYKVGRHPWGVRIALYYPRSFSLKFFELRDPARIVLDIYSKSDDLYAELISIIEKKKEVEGRDSVERPISKAMSTPVIYEDRVIVIDAGHGGTDPGAIGYGGLMEKHVNLAIAKKVADFLKKDGRFKVILTRDGDYFIPLHRRAEIALKNRADLFISIHSDAAPDRNPHAKGTQVFALSYERAVEKRRQILSSERYAKLVLGEAANVRSRVVRKVLADLAIDVTLNESVYFAKLLARELKSVAGRDVYFKGINRAGFAVLKTPGIPSVLVETAFITNPSEAENLKDPEFQRKVAWAIYRAVVRYFYGEDFGQKLVKYQQ